MYICISRCTVLLKSYNKNMKNVMYFTDVINYEKDKCI